MVSRLAARLKENPEDPEGWMMLGRSYAGARAASASQRSLRQEPLRACRATPSSSRIYADALAMAQGRTLQRRAERILLRALAHRPQ